MQQMLSCVYSMNVCVCLLKKWLCVPNENTSSILWTVKRFDGKESSCKGSVRFSSLCERFSVFCVQFWESRYCFEKRVLAIVKNYNGIVTCTRNIILRLSDICWAYSVMHTTEVAWKLGHVLLWSSSWLIWVYGEN